MILGMPSNTWLDACASKSEELGGNCINLNNDSGGCAIRRCDSDTLFYMGYYSLGASYTVYTKTYGCDFKFPDP